MKPTCELVAEMRVGPRGCNHVNGELCLPELETSKLDVWKPSMHPTLYTVALYTVDLLIKAVDLEPEESVNVYQKLLTSNLLQIGCIYVNLSYFAQIYLFFCFA